MPQAELRQGRTEAGIRPRGGEPPEESWSVDNTPNVNIIFFLVSCRYTAVVVVVVVVDSDIGFAEASSPSSQVSVVVVADLSRLLAPRG